jgi:hypothetical protein
LAAQYARPRGRRGAAKATVAVGHSLRVAAFHMLDRQQPYHELGPDYFRARYSRQHHLRRLLRQIDALGYKVSVEGEAA